MGGADTAQRSFQALDLAGGGRASCFSCSPRVARDRLCGPYRRKDHYDHTASGTAAAPVIRLSGWDALHNRIARYHT
jgi:hypothetical protein